ncbi:MAG: hypothetical protein GXY83_27520, partial [Rhodopirellula sp.]|nr:hypothetical protein [Rhodopirellula sp.]
MDVFEQDFHQREAAGITPSAASTRLDFATRTIHAGQTPDPTTGAVMTPIYTTSTYAQQSPGGICLLFCPKQGRIASGAASVIEGHWKGCGRIWSELPRPYGGS